MASLIGASSFLLHAQEINIENYDMLSQIEKEQNFTNVIVKLEEGRTLEELQGYGIKFKKSETIPFEYHNIIIENNGYDMLEELNNTGLFGGVILSGSGKVPPPPAEIIAAKRDESKLASPIIGSKNGVNAPCFH